MKASTPAAAQILFMALAVAMDVAAAAWLTLLGLEPIETGVEALTVPILTGLTFAALPGAPNVTMLPPGICPVPAADSPAVAIVLIIFPLFVLVSTISFVGVDEATFVVLVPLEPAAVTVEIVLVAALTVVFITELDDETATVFIVSVVIFALTLLKCPISLINFAVSLDSCLQSALNWVKSLHASCFSTVLGSCLTRTCEGKCVEDTAQTLTGFPELATDFVFRGPFM